MTIEHEKSTPTLTQSNQSTYVYHWPDGYRPTVVGEIGPEENRRSREYVIASVVIVESSTTDAEEECASWHTVRINGWPITGNGELAPFDQTVAARRVYGIADVEEQYYQQHLNGEIA